MDWQKRAYWANLRTAYLRLADGSYTELEIRDRLAEMGFSRFHAALVHRQLVREERIEEDS